MNMLNPTLPTDDESEAKLNSAQLKVQDAINELHWESKDEDDSVWNPGGVTLEKLVEKINAEIVSEGEWRDIEDTETPRSGGEPYQPREKGVTLKVDGTEVKVVVIDDWHSGVNSGNTFEDVYLFEE